MSNEKVDGTCLWIFERIRRSEDEPAERIYATK